MNTEIKNIYGHVIYSSEKPTLKEALEEAVEKGANLDGANLVRAYNLVRANLDGANLVRANLDGANLVRANTSTVPTSTVPTSTVR